MSNFEFLKAEWPDLYGEARRAERLAIADPRTSCFYARRTIELALNWLYKVDATLKEPYQRDLSAMLNEPTLVNQAGPALRAKMDLIRRQGNLAVHSARQVHSRDATRTVAELFHVMYWLARNYAQHEADVPPSTLAFEASLIPVPEPASVRQKKQAELQAMAARYTEQQKELARERRRSQDLDAEVQRLREQIKGAKLANSRRHDTHDYNEAETRAHIIDLLLHEAGWPLDRDEDREYPVEGLPTRSGKGKVDYVLWDDDGRPLGLVEAKATTRSPMEGQEQARQYATALEHKFGRRPVIFYTNGYQTWIWDDGNKYPPRPIQGFYTKDELRSLIARRASRQALSSTPINEEIVERYYQSRAIRRIGERFDRDKQRQALLVMATGSGKTRTAIALVDVLQKAGWIKRVLFLADRKELVTQATNAFKQHLPGTPVVNLLTDRDDSARVYVSTYPTMLNLINNLSDIGERRFGPGYFDLVIVDEAHRSIFNKYKAIFKYFDALLVGLTATPKNEIDHNTYRVFNLEEGNPTDAYDLEEAKEDGYLVGPFSVNVPLRFPQRGVRYDDLSEEEKERWDELDWDEEDGVPAEVSADEVNRFLFNEDTIDKMLQTVMTYGYHVEGGDRLGKTIVFARNQRHAEFIVRRFDQLYPEHGGEFARVISHRTRGAEQLIDQFRRGDSALRMAVSVDMLDTGIDIPEVANLVLAKAVRSKTKFWQMIGRGTRLCKDLFGPGRDKQQFLVFDLARNVEYFNADVPETQGRTQKPLSERVFAQRADLLHALDQGDPPAEKDAAVRDDVATRLRGEVAGMNRNNIEVRRHLREVDTFLDPDTWKQITAEKRDDLKEKLAGLPSSYKDDDDTSEEAKRFDLLSLRLQLGLLNGDPGYDTLRRQVQGIAEDLLDPTTLNNPVVARHIDLITDVAGEDWWQDVTLAMLETMRRTIRRLVRLIPTKHRAVVYTDFEDELGDLTHAELKGLEIGTDRTKFERKVRTYLRSHADNLVVQKLLRGRQITSSDLDELKNVFLDLDFGTESDIDEIAEQHDGFGLFLRSITGLSREAAIHAFDDFQKGRTLSAVEYNFIELIIDSLAKNGYLEAGDLYEPPFKRYGDPDVVFHKPSDVEVIANILKSVKETAIPAEAAAS
ncbi:restriction endonuclease subunit R [Spongiactinospora gelatinilytica]|uniref:Restriction endonuclease subunit R n=1 Tax=Spongiactinospora gelatinilytica TaxID=2666298 RepID=A0A2W2FLS8_9ACTN|nr:DEAD/DEAH box helicase family protein [Spongiactinospora gelatinilytica]PZG36671.1 restriction endonuclease subunit R [Spongiactinospora gelatinilytica]